MSDFPSVSPGGSSTGLDAKIAGLLTYVLGFLTGIVFLLIEKKSEFVKFHAAQSTIVFLAIAIVTTILKFIPFIGGIVNSLIGLITLVLWIVLMLKTYQGETIRLPYVADIADQLVKKVG